jgi:hypothetical protein
VAQVLRSTPSISFSTRLIIVTVAAGHVRIVEPRELQVPDAKTAIKYMLGAAVILVAFFVTLWVLDAFSSARVIQAPAVWDDRLYLALNPDVAASVKRGDYKTGQEQYVISGKQENKPAGYVPGDWDEAGFLKANPDVAKLVNEGAYVSGYHYYLLVGRKQGRAAVPLSGK